MTLGAICVPTRGLPMDGFQRKNSRKGRFYLQGVSSCAPIWH